MTTVFLFFALTEAMPDTCFSCQLALSDECGAVKCSECTKRYHFGKCAGILEKSYKGKPESTKKTWRCQSCRSTGKYSESGEDSSDVNVAAILVSINSRLEKLPPLMEKVEGMEQSLMFMSRTFEELKNTISAQESEIKILKKKVAELESKECNNHSLQAQLHKEVCDLEYKSRQLNLEIQGVPAVQGENLVSVLNQVADKLDVPRLSEQDIVCAHRLPTRQNNIPGIIVRFTRQSFKDLWMRNKRKLKDAQPRIFIQDNLTRHSRQLLKATKDWARENSFKFAWYAHGKVFLRKCEGARAVHVKSSDDLISLQLT